MSIQLLLFVEPSVRSVDLRIMCCITCQRSTGSDKTANKNYVNYCSITTRILPRVKREIARDGRLVDSSPLIRVRPCILYSAYCSHSQCLDSSSGFSFPPLSLPRGELIFSTVGTSFCAAGLDLLFSLLGPFHGAIAVPSVTRCRCRRRIIIK